MEDISNDNYTKEQIRLEREKDAVYINYTDVNEENINKFYKFYKYKVKRFDFISFLICGTLLIIIAIYNLIKADNNFWGIVWNIIINAIFIITGICFWMLAFKTQKFNKQSMKKIYTEEDISKIRNNYYFEENRVIVVNKFGETDRVYEYLESIYEDKECYYIFINSRNAYIVDKKGFIKGEEEGFNEFIQRKMEKLYKKRCKRKKEK